MLNLNLYIYTEDSTVWINKLYCIVLYCIVLYCIVLYCIVLYCIVLYCIVLYCIVLYCIKKKVIELQRAIIRESLGVGTIGFHIRKDQAFSY